ncbi:divalent metal cation transporter, partial [Burkholderia contaminans]|nr:divalent metal cation transporter [Burkholderia contaminans]
MIPVTSKPAGGFALPDLPTGHTDGAARAARAGRPPGVAARRPFVGPAAGAAIRDIDHGPFATKKQPG